MNVFLEIIDWVLFVPFAVWVIYLLIFSAASAKRTEGPLPEISFPYRVAVLIPSYKGDRVIERTVGRLLRQSYPADRIKIVVISDRMGQRANEALKKLPVEVLFPCFEKSSKARALNFAMQYLEKEEPFDIVTILDCDNLVESGYIQDLCNAYGAGARAIQAHRVAKNMNTDTAVLDAVSEEINNSIFRLGHVNLGFSSALIGSGMAFDYRWFARHAGSLVTAGEDKELEVLLLKEHIKIRYLPHTLVYDEKVAHTKTFYTQRRRWLAAQFGILAVSLKELPKALYRKNWDYCDKLFQWMMLPRVIILCVILVMSIIVPFTGLAGAVKWWILLLLLAAAFIFSIPPYLVDKKLWKALRRIPVMGILMITNLFKIKGVNKNFIHTEHNI